MTVPNSIITPQTAKNALAVTTQQNTVLGDAPVNTVELLTATAPSRVTRIQTTQRFANATAFNLQLFLSKDAGVTKRLIGMRLAPVQTFSAAVAPALIDFGFSDAAPLFLMTGDQLFVGQAANMTNGFSWLVEWQEF